MALTDIAIRAAKPAERLTKLSDGGGLQLWITPDGAKRWRLAYRYVGLQKTLAIGVYPASAFVKRAPRVKKPRSSSPLEVDPSLARKLAKGASATSNTNTFDVIAAELLEKKRREGKATGTLEHWAWLLRLASPTIGARPIADITAQEVLSALRVVEARGRHETVRKMRGAIGEVFRYAVATGALKTIRRARSRAR